MVEVEETIVRLRKSRELKWMEQSALVEAADKWLCTIEAGQCRKYATSKSIVDVPRAAVNC